MLICEACYKTGRVSTRHFTVAEALSSKASSRIPTKFIISNYSKTCLTDKIHFISFYPSTFLFRILSVNADGRGILQEFQSESNQNFSQNSDQNSDQNLDQNSVCKSSC